MPPRRPARAKTKAPTPTFLRIAYEDKTFEIELPAITYADLRDIRRAAGLTFAEMGAAASALVPEFVGGLVWLQLRATNPKISYDDVLAKMPMATDWELTAGPPG